MLLITYTCCPHNPPSSRRVQRFPAKARAIPKRGKTAFGRAANFWKENSTIAAGQFLHFPPKNNSIISSFPKINSFPFLRPPLQACMDSMCDDLESNNTDLCPQDCQKGGRFKVGKSEDQICSVLEMGGQVKEGLHGGIARITSPNMSCRWKVSIAKNQKLLFPFCSKTQQGF